MGNGVGAIDDVCAGNGQAWRVTRRSSNTNEREEELLNQLHENAEKYQLGDPEITAICDQDLGDDAVDALVAGKDGKCDINKADKYLNACSVMSAFNAAMAIQAADAGMDRGVPGEDEDPFSHTFDNTNGGVDLLIGAASKPKSDDVPGGDRVAKPGQYGLDDMTKDIWNVLVSGGGEYCKDLFPRFPKMHRGENHPNYWIMMDTLNACKTLKKIVASQRKKCVYIQWGDPTSWPKGASKNWLKKFSKQLTKICKYFANMKYTGVRKPKRIPRCPTCGGVPKLSDIVKKNNGAHKPVNNGGVKKKTPVKKRPPQKKKPKKKKKKKRRPRRPRY